MKPIQKALDKAKGKVEPWEKELMSDYNKRERAYKKTVRSINTDKKPKKHRFSINDIPF